MGRIREWAGRQAKRVAEALLGGGWLDDAGDDMTGYRRLTDGSRYGPRDLEPLSQEKALKIARWQYDSHAMAGWAIDHRVGLIIGDELGFSVEVNAAHLKLTDEEARALEQRIKARLEAFWDSPVFSIRYRADELFTSFLVDGELLMPLSFSNPIDGLPQLDMADTARIKGLKMAAGSGLVVEGVVLKPPMPGEADPEFDVVRFNPAVQRYEGEAFFFRHSRIANAQRGRPALLRQADWFDIMDQVMFARADKAGLLNAMVWDVTLKGAGQPDIEKKAAEIRKNPPTNPGSVRVHNDAEEWKAVTPDLQAEDASAEMAAFRNFLLGTMGMPESWFGGGGEVTRTTAGEQNDIALMQLRRDRKLVRWIFGTMLHFAYDAVSAKQPTLFPPRAKGGLVIKPDLPPLDEKDISRLGGVVQNVVAALEAAIERKLCSYDTARKVLLHLVDRLGVPVDPDDDKARIDAEKKDGTYDDLHRGQQLMADALQRAKVPGPVGAASARQADTHPEP